MLMSTTSALLLISTAPILMSTTLVLFFLNWTTTCEDDANEEVEEDDLGLITDPLRKGSSTSSIPVESQTASFNTPPSDAKILEIPVTIDAEALASGKTIRIVLNLRG